MAKCGGWIKKKQLGCSLPRPNFEWLKREMRKIQKTKCFRFSFLFSVEAHIQALARKYPSINTTQMRGAHFKFRLQSCRDPTNSPKLLYIDIFFCSSLALVLVVVVVVVVVVDGVVVRGYSPPLPIAECGQIKTVNFLVENPKVRCNSTRLL